VITVGVELALIGALVAGASSPPGVAGPDSPETLLSDTVARIVKGRAKPIAASIYEPKTWSASEAGKDRKEITGQLEFLFRELGRFSSPSAVSPAPIYTLDIAGADIPYWQSVPDRGIARTATYAGRFEKAGDGVVVLTLTQLSGRWELRSVAFGIEMKRRGARETMLRVARRFLAKIRPDMSKADIDAAAEAALGGGPGQSI
jgi:hypothetical protein